MTKALKTRQGARRRTLRFMPNGFDRAYAELKIVCAGYHIRFHEWPTIIELHPRAL